MYVDLVLLFLIYAFSVISLGVSIYALWTLKEIEQIYRARQSTTARKFVQPAIKIKRPKGHWD